MRIVLLLTALAYAQIVSAQSWKEMMHDPAYNFYEVCAAADAYFETHDKDVKGSGWKGYQRWKDENESKYYPSGDRSNVDPNFAATQYQRFLEENPTPKELFPNGWNELGPYTIDSLTGHYSAGLGRVEDLYVAPNNTDRMYLGSRSGGFWRTLDGGATWSAGLTDDLFATGVNALSARPSNNTDVIINVQNSSNSTTHGVYRSTDSGDNWMQTAFNPTNLGTGGLGSSFKIFEVEYHPTTSNLIFIGTSSGLYRSDDDLATWTEVITSGDIIQVKFHPTNPNIIYAYDSKSSSGLRNYVYISSDAGVTWSLSNQVSGNSNSKAFIDVSPNCPDCVFFRSGNGVWKSVNQAANFSFISDPGESNGAFAVSDTDTSVMVIGYIDPFITTDGGQSFTQSAWWSLGSAEHGLGAMHENFMQTQVYVHADLRAAKSVNGVLYMGTDGFLVKSEDNGMTWEILNQGTSIRENYTLGVSQSNHYVTMIGSQDNGTSLTNEGGWLEFYGADGMEAIVHPLNPDWMIGSYQYGGRRRTEDGGASQSGINPSNETGSGDAAWVAPLAYKPDSQFDVYHFSDEVWKADQFGNGTWVELGSPASFGGLMEQAAFAENNSDILAVSRDGNIDISVDGGLTFADIQGTLPGAEIKDIAFDPRDDSTIVVVYNQYQNNGNKVFITTDMGGSWTNITYNLNDMPIRSVVIDHSNSSYIYLGAEIGVFIMEKGGSNWSLYNSGLPNMTVREMEINYGSNTVRAATWGRGMWEYTLKDRGDYPAILTTEITNPPTMIEPKEDVDQYVTSVISYDNTITSAYVEWSSNQPVFGNVISMTNTQDSTWVSDSPLPNFPEGTKMFFKVFAIGANGDTTETYKFMYEVRYNVDAGLNEIANAQSMFVFPNPNDGTFSVQLSSVMDEVQILILAMDGKKVSRSNYTNTERVDINAELAPGSYFVLVEGEGISEVQKVVIQK